MASKKKTQKTKTTKPRATKAKKSRKKSKKGTRKLFGAALAKHNEKLARMGKPPVSAGAASTPVAPSKRLHPPKPPGARKYKPLTPPKRHRKPKMVPAADVQRVRIATDAKHAADELAEATRELKKLKHAVGAAKTSAPSRRKKLGKRQKAAASAAFKARHGMSPAAYLKSKRPAAKKERHVTAKELLAKPGSKGAKKVPAGIGGKKLHVWLCAGPRRTGCGGGKKGGHVIGMLR